MHVHLRMWVYVYACMSIYVYWVCVHVRMCVHVYARMSVRYMCSYVVKYDSLDKQEFYINNWTRYKQKPDLIIVVMDRFVFYVSICIYFILSSKTAHFNTAFRKNNINWYFWNLRFRALRIYNIQVLNKINSINYKECY